MHIVTPTLLLVVFRLQAYRVLVGTLKEERVDKSMVTATKHVAQRLRKNENKVSCPYSAAKALVGFSFCHFSTVSHYLSFTWAHSLLLYFFHYSLPIP